MRSDRIVSGCYVVRVDVCGGLFLGDLPTIPSPGIVHAVLRIKVACRNARSQRFPHHYFGRLHRTSSDWSQRGRTSPAEDHPRTQTSAIKRGPPQVRKLGSRVRGIVVPSEDIIRLEHSPGKILGKWQIPAAAQNGSDSVDAVGQSLHRETVVAEQSVQEDIRALGAPHKARPGRKGAVAPAVSQIEFGSPMAIEVVSKCSSEAGRHIRNFVRSRIVRIAKWGRHGRAGVCPLIAKVNVILRNGIALSRGRGGKRYHCGTYGQDSCEQRSPAFANFHDDLQT